MNCQCWPGGRCSFRATPGLGGLHVPTRRPGAGCRVAGPLAQPLETSCAPLVSGGGAGGSAKRRRPARDQSPSRGPRCPNTPGSGAPSFTGGKTKALPFVAPKILGPAWLLLSGVCAVTHLLRGLAGRALPLGKAHLQGQYLLHPLHPTGLPSFRGSFHDDVETSLP